MLERQAVTSIYLAVILTFYEDDIFRFFLYPLNTFYTFWLHNSIEQYQVTNRIYYPDFSFAEHLEVLYYFFLIMLKIIFLIDSITRAIHDKTFEDQWPNISRVCCLVARVRLNFLTLMCFLQDINPEISS